MENNYMIIVFAFLSIYFTCGFLKGTTNIIRDIGYNSKFFPEYYVKPKQKFIKFFKIGRELIPKHLYYEYFVAPIYVVLFPISVCIYQHSNCNEEIGDILFDVYVLLISVNSIYTAICHIVYKKAH